jgi:hypothetical protein
MFLGLREQVFDVDPETVGLAATDPADRVWGCLMETGYPNATATLVCLRDGTTSLSTSSGFGIIGGGAHRAVVRANAALLATLAADLDRLAASNDGRCLSSVTNVRKQPHAHVSDRARNAGERTA